MNDSLSKKKSNFYFSLDGKFVEENIESLNFLRFLYKNFLGKTLRKLFINRYISKIYGSYQNSFLSKKKILPFIERHNINTAEFKKNISEFRSFNDFFTRELKSEARPIVPDENILISPADSKLFVATDIFEKTNFFVKNEKFNLEFFLQNKNLAYEYFNGTMMLFRLAPYDYHRFHFPADCIPSKPIRIPGKYESVNPIVYSSGVQPLIKNERHLIILETEEFGEVLVVLVGALLVGKIIETFVSERRYNKGDEMGYFAFGGSTVALIFKQGVINPKEIFLKHSSLGYETEIKMGQAVNI